MGNCLKTQLKAIVDNDNLEYFNAIVVEFLGGGSNPQYIDVTSQDADLTLSIIEGDFNFVNSAGVDSGLKEVTLPAGRTSWYSSFCIPTDGVGKVLVSSKYDIDTIDGGGPANWAAGVKIQLESLQGCEKLKLIRSGSNNTPFYGAFTKIPSSVETCILSTSRDNIYDDITNWAHPNIKDFQFTYPTHVTGNISNLNLPSLEAFVVYSSANLIGDIIGFERSVNLNTLTINNTKFEGSIDALAAAIITNKPNRSGTLAVTGNGKITYKANGDGTGEDTVITNGTVKTITFDGQGGYTIS